LGRACVKALAAAGVVVDGVDIIDTPVPGTASWTVADVADDDIPEALLAQAGTLVHLAWRNDPGRGNSNMADDVQTNVAGAVRTFERAAQAGVRRIIYPSSGGTIYGKEPPLPTPESAPLAPVGGYGAGKAAAEMYLNAINLAYGTQTCALRIGNPYGPGQYPDRGQGFIATAIGRTLRGAPIQVFGTDTLARDYVYIADVAESFVLACTADTLPPALNVGSGIDRSISDLIPLIFAAAGRSTEIEQLPGRSVDVPRVQLDISLIRQTLGWQPRTPIEDGLQMTINWLTQEMSKS
jgi:UDP-glucose 4-epimerase